MPIPYGGSTKARIDLRLFNQANALKNQNKSVQSGLSLPGLREWMIGYTGADGWDGDPYSHSGIAAAFSRTDIWANYAQVVSNPQKPGTAADTISLRMQNDAMASMERAMHVQKMRPVRATILAAARRKGHGADNGVIARMVDDCAVMIRQGAIDVAVRGIVGGTTGGA